MEIPHFARPGSVVYLRQDLFYDTPGVYWTRRPDRPGKSSARPFLCIRREQVGNSAASLWLALTHERERLTGKGERLQITRADKIGSSRSWLDPGIDTFVDDPSYLWLIQDAAFESGNLQSLGPAGSNGVLPACLQRILTRVESPHEIRRRFEPGGRPTSAKSRAVQITTLRPHASAMSELDDLLRQRVDILSKQYRADAALLRAANGYIVELVVWQEKQPDAGTPMNSTLGDLRTQLLRVSEIVPFVSWSEAPEDVIVLPIFHGTGQFTGATSVEFTHRVPLRMFLAPFVRSGIRNHARALHNHSLVITEPWVFEHATSLFEIIPWCVNPGADSTAHLMTFHWNQLEDLTQDAPIGSSSMWTADSIVCVAERASS